MKKRKAQPIIEVGHLKASIRYMERDNPMWSKEHDGAVGNPKKVTVAVNIHESAIGTMAARGLLDEAQVKAGDRLRYLMERAGGAGARAIDYAREPVDGGNGKDPIPDMVIDAAKQLAQVSPLVGRKAYAILQAVIRQGCELKDIARTQREKTTTADYIKDALDILAEHWGYTKGKTPQKSRNAGY